MIVVDTNVIAYLFITGDYTDQATRLLNTDPFWISPPLWKSEFRNVLALYMRKGHLNLNKAQKLMEESEKFIQSDYEINSEDVLQLVSVSSCSAYDCEFISLAKSFNNKLHITDKKLISEFPDLTISLKLF